LRPGPRWVSLQRFPDPIAGGNWLPRPKNLTPDLGTADLGLRPSLRSFLRLSRQDPGYGPAVVIDFDAKNVQ